MKSESNHFKYTSNVWLTSAILTPCIFGFIMTFVEARPHEIPFFVGLAVPFGIILSIPNYLIFLLLVSQINTSQFSNVKKKVIINFFGVVLTFALFMLVFHRPNGVEPEGLQFAFAYSATLTFGIWFFNLDRQVPETFLKKKRLPKIKMLEDILDDERY